jgi:hypothetical protein
MTPPTANATCTKHQAPASLAAQDSRHAAATLNIMHARATGVADQSDRAVLLMKRHGRHDLPDVAANAANGSMTLRVKTRAVLLIFIASTPSTYCFM